MNLQKKIAFFKQQANSAALLRQVATENLELATRLESEAKTALEELGVRQERGRKAPTLTEKQITTLLGNLTQ